ncbi:hypothetical protein H0H92_014248 [Tricholoma furcatifolium]|nr:hypothetical protein H0H92_014248 [Tricholoma furcatifolium]
MQYMKAKMNDEDTSKLQIMLNIAKLECAPLDLTPAMEVELKETEEKAKKLGASVIPLMLMTAAKDKRGVQELPMNEATLRE